MQNQVELWLSEQPDRRIAAIAVDLDHFARFNQDYGQTIGDIILSKVAKKVRSYVQESGMPVRAGGEEFLLLLPDVDLRTAAEIAEQVRKGVEKLRFVSARDKKSLPKITISLGVALYQASENWYQFLSRTNNVLQLAKQRGRNQVARSDHENRCFGGRVHIVGDARNMKLHQILACARRNQNTPEYGAKNNGQHRESFDPAVGLYQTLVWQQLGQNAVLGGRVCRGAQAHHCV